MLTQASRATCTLPSSSSSGHASGGAERHSMGLNTRTHASSSCQAPETSAVCLETLTPCFCFPATTGWPGGREAGCCHRGRCPGRQGGVPPVPRSILPVQVPRTRCDHAGEGRPGGHHLRPRHAGDTQVWFETGDRPPHLQQCWTGKASVCSMACSPSSMGCTRGAPVMPSQ